ncbi:MAG: hypothetical protein ACKO9V_00900 [Candidatus Kapaibacterium sp.]
MMHEEPGGTADESAGDAVAPVGSRQGLSLVLVAVAIAASTFGVWQYSIKQDRIAGENARLAQQVQDMQKEHSGAEHAQLEQQRAVARTLQDSLRRSPGDTSLYVQLGAALIATGDTLGSLNAYRKYVLEINPENAGAQTDYGYLLFITGSRDEGRSRTLAVWKKNPKNQVAMYNLAAMSFKEDRLDDALAWMDRCIQADPSSELSAMAKSAKEQIRQQKAGK